MVGFQISSGLVSQDAACIGSAYSGAPGHVNNPADVALKAQGPIPPGIYHIGAPINDPQLGIFCLPLTPAPQNVMYGRGGFFVHGDNASKPPQSSSEGCIVTDHATRVLISRDPDELIEVTV